MFTIDVRSKDDKDREVNVVRIESDIYKICKKRGVACSVERKVPLNVMALLSVPAETVYLNDAQFHQRCFSGF